MTKSWLALRGGGHFHVPTGIDSTDSYDTLNSLEKAWANLLPFVNQGEEAVCPANPLGHVTRFDFALVEPGEVAQAEHGLPHMVPLRM